MDAHGAHSSRRDDAAAMTAGLLRLRANRVSPARDVTITAVLSSEIRRFRQIERAAVGVGNAWDELMTAAGLAPELVRSARVVSFRAGLLTVRVSSAPAKYAFDRFLRSGGEAALARLTPAPLRRVKLVI